MGLAVAALAGRLVHWELGRDLDRGHFGTDEWAATHLAEMFRVVFAGNKASTDNLAGH